MSEKHSTRPSSILLLGLLISAALLLGSRLSLDGGRIVWRPFGEPRHSFGHSACGIPIHVSLGEVDPRFGYDRGTVSRAMGEAAGLWQASVEQELFLQSGHSRSMVVSLEFDDRQHSANVRRTLRGGIDRDRTQLQSREASLKQSGDRIELAQSVDGRERMFLEGRLRDHQARVSAFNAAGDSRDDAQRRMLEREAGQLQAEFAELDRRRERLNRDIDEHNRRVNAQRQQVDALQGSVEQYNAFASGDPIESGRYSHDAENGRRIAVFRAADYNELVLILAHEFGHALGLLHVEQPGAVMNALLHEGGASKGRRAVPVPLGDADRDALRRLCGDRLQGRARN